MKIHGSYTSPYVRHCRIALLQTGAQCEFIETDYAQSAANSATQKVPYLIDGQVKLSDSTSILRYLYERNSASFIADVDELELFCMVNTCLDTAINLFLLEKDGIDAQNCGYIKRQQSRIESSLCELDVKAASAQLPLNTGTMRLACFLDWAQYRNRVDLAPHANLLHLLSLARQNSEFNATGIPQ